MNDLTPTHELIALVVVCLTLLAWLAAWALVRADKAIKARYPYGQKVSITFTFHNTGEESVIYGTLIAVVTRTNNGAHTPCAVVELGDGKIATHALESQNSAVSISMKRVT